ncbi:2'-5' RNA ligase family protein, partial [Klebsiella pneumoniae]|uniref:2'-5' RNA ligase family protein n=1 Tax=Klebsiella pneumoniae TaxID=573 RepID=UPI00272DD36B
APRETTSLCLWQPSPPRGLLQLASMLRAQAARSGCYQSPQPFHPHITLWRDARRAVPIQRRRQDERTLLASRDGVRGKEKLDVPIKFLWNYAGNTI